MTHLFLTQSDVRSAAEGATTITVDDRTIVTPQAIEAARELGVLIYNSQGPYKPPPPDRGPDASRDLDRLLPPDARSAGATTTFVVAAVGHNKPGVLNLITTKIAEFEGSIEDISQRIVDSYFELTVVVNIPPHVHFGQVKQALECLSTPNDIALRVMHEKVFRFMHRL